MKRFRSTAGVLALSAAVALPAIGCGQPSSRGNDRWVTTENTAVDIDWDAVGEAYKKAEGPEDFEQRVNEIYTGSEIISVGVHDVDAKTQEVTGFFDKNTNGAVEDGEKVFTIRRNITGEGQGNYQIQGHNRYASYRSPFWDIAAGMVVGSMISRAFMPSYRPMYSQPYYTPASRRTSLATHRDSYRKANPSKFSQSKTGTKSQSGRRYGRGGGNFNKSRTSTTPRRRPSAPRRMGGRFGLGDRGTRRVIALS
mgnify:CR=1 FL=1